MIRINIINFAQISKKHCDTIFPRIEQKYMSNVHHPGIQFFQNKSGKFDEELVKAILIEDFKTILQIPKVKWIYNICSIAFRNPCPVSEYMKSIGQNEWTKTEAEQVRKDFVNRFDFDNQNYFQNNSFTFDFKQHKIHSPYYYKTERYFKNFIKPIKVVAVSINEFINNIINYDLLDGDYRHELISSLKIATCPYCNRQYITNYYDKKGIRKTTADLEHFYTQKLFPIFSLSLYNFIPSCLICNLRMKSMHTDEIVYPYEEEFGLEGKFVTEFIDNNIDIDFMRGGSNNFDLKIKVDNNSKICNKINASKNLFMLEEVYQSHKDYVRELLFKKHSIDSVKKEELMALFGSSLLTDNEIDLLLYGNHLNRNEWEKRPLAKLTHDIIKLGVK